MTRWHGALLRLASLGVPARLRSEWLRTWRSEFWYVPRRHATAFCLGAMKDAALLGRDHSGERFDSPLHYLLALTACSAAVYLLGLTAVKATLSLSDGSHAKEEPTAFALLFLLLMGVGVLVGRSQGVAWPVGFRDGAFLVVKLAAAVPIFYGTLFLGIALRAPVLHPLIAFVLVARCVFSDQLRRCPHCLRYLRAPVAIGCASDTFLHWYGTETLCLRCRALLQVPDASARYCAVQRWVRLDDSWDEVLADHVELPL